MVSDIQYDIWYDSIVLYSYVDLLMCRYSWFARFSSDEKSQKCFRMFAFSHSCVSVSW